MDVGGWPESQQSRSWPLSVRREATVRSSLPSSMVIESRKAGRKSVDLFQFLLRTSSMRLPGSRPVTLPVFGSFLTMYGPVNATYWSYVDGFFWSYFLAYSCGTGTVIGITSAAETRWATGLVSLMTSVWLSGVWRPAKGLSLEMLTGELGAPLIS